MPLSSNIVSQFVKATTGKTQNTKKETVVYGTITSYDVNTETAYVRLDGAKNDIPVTHFTTTVNTSERVTVMIKNHTAIITGNLASPSPSRQYVDDKTYIRKSVIENLAGAGFVENYGIISLDDNGEPVYIFEKHVPSAEGMQTIITTEKILTESSVIDTGDESIDLADIRALWPDCNYE